MIGLTEEQIPMTQWWWKLMKRSISRSRKLPSKLELLMCVNLHMTDWVAAQLEDPVLKAMIDCISSWKVQNLKHLLGDKTTTEERVAILQRVEKADGLSRSPLSLSYTSWQTGRSYAVCSPHGSSSGCYEWMSPRCWTPGSVANAVPAAGLVLMVWHDHADAESNKQLQMINPTWRHLCQSTSAAHHWHHSFGATTCRLHKHWDNYGAAPTTECGECSGFLWSLMKHIKAYMMWPPTKLWRLLLNFYGRDTSQSLEPQESSWVIEVQILKVTSLKSCVSSWAYERLGLHLTCSDQQTSWASSSNAYTHDREA